MWGLVGNPEDRFSHNKAQIILDHQFHTLSVLLKNSDSVDESDNEDCRIETEDSLTSLHISEPVVEKEPKNDESTKTRSRCKTAGKITKPGENTSRKQKNNLKSAKSLKNKVVLDDIRKLNKGSKTVRINRNKTIELKTKGEETTVEHTCSEEKFACEVCPEKLESNGRIDKVGI